MANNNEKWIDIKICTPAINQSVIIKTNWSSYFARLKISEFGGSVFHVFDSNHRVQLTTVTGWKLADQT